MRTFLIALTAVALATGSAAADELKPTLYFGSLDELTHDDFSSTASSMSDALFVIGLTAPVVLELGRNDDDTGRRLAAYAGGVATTGAVAGILKELWRRPRPYNFHASPAVRAYAKHAGKDATVSFPSGHTALTFAAAAAGGWIYADGSTDTTARAGVWFAGTAIAGATAVLRMRAGKHYPSDVTMGILLGAGAVAVPAAVLGDVDLSGTEVAAMVGGTLLGAGIMSVIPFPRDVSLPLDISPLALRDGGGVAITVVR
ncbi:MAG: phosphatase PAP2 family protein [Kofleriaceae bacterium]|nr:MAG: phosphatase PAP2 family protein [Kofleriaceae bacterium]MBZ0238782.1 phosphatase PAP2 family protein [Kofleriaceae bacterium]